MEELFDSLTFPEFGVNVFYSTPSIYTKAVHEEARLLIDQEIV